MSSHKTKHSSFFQNFRQARLNTNGKVSLKFININHLKRQNSHIHIKINNQSCTPTTVNRSSISSGIKNSQINIKSSFKNSIKECRDTMIEKGSGLCCNKFSIKKSKACLTDSSFLPTIDSCTNKLKLSEINLNLKYSDIVYKKQPVSMFSIAKDLCTTGKNLQFQQQFSNKSEGILTFLEFTKTKKRQYGCKCQVKCLAVDKWLEHNGVNTIKQKQYDPKAHSRYVAQIQKDLRRTQPYQTTFQCEMYLFWLKQTLSTYAKLDPQIGYTQGMNFIASIFVYHSPDLASCIKLMEIFFIKKNFRSIYTNDFNLCKHHSEIIVKTLEKKCSNVYNFYVEVHQIYLQIFIQGWLFTLLGNVIPIDYMRFVIDMFMEESFTGIYKIICTLLLYLYDKKQLKLLQDATDIMQLLSIQSLAKCGIDWQEVLLSSYNFPISQKQTKKKNILWVTLK